MINHHKALEAIARIEKYVLDYEDAPSWGGPTMYPAPPSIADLKAILALSAAPASPASERNAGEVERLGRFGFHPDPAIDFLCEVEAIEGEAYDVGATSTLTATLLPRIDRAMQFRVGGDACAVKAKITLRQIECALRNGTIKSFMNFLIAQRGRGVELYRDAGK